MFPNVNPKQMQKMMKKMGMSMDEVDAQEVIIVHSDGTETHVSNPQVIRMKVQGKDSFQITGDVQEAGKSEVTLEVSDDDVNMIVEQAGVTEEQARKALEESGGDIAKAILDLEKE